VQLFRGRGVQRGKFFVKPFGDASRAECRRGHQKQPKSPVFSLSSPKFRGHRLAFASLFVPDFPVQAVVRLEPELRGQPVAILVGAPPLAKVFAVNCEARNLDVETGMTKSPG
jgi:hypothetical protein